MNRGVLLNRALSVIITPSISPCVSRPEVVEEFRLRLHIRGVFVVHFNGRCPIDRERARQRFVVMCEDLLLTSASKGCLFRPSELVF